MPTWSCPSGSRTADVTFPWGKVARRSRDGRGAAPAPDLFRLLPAEQAPIHAAPAGGRLPLRGRWQGEALTDEGRNPKSIGRARLSGKTSRPRRGRCPHRPATLRARPAGINVPFRPSGPRGDVGIAPYADGGFSQYNVLRPLFLGVPSTPGPAGPPSESTEGRGCPVSAHDFTKGA